MTDLGGYQTGVHYPSQRDTVMPVLARTYGTAGATPWWTRWRTFFIACAELFAYNNGQEWWVSHYLFEQPGG
jgi:cyclopropane-fatty-acyl-phospholipid synthase